MIGRKKKDKTTISPLLTFNLKVGFTFSVLSPLACFDGKNLNINHSPTLL